MEIVDRKMCYNTVRVSGFESLLCQDLEKFSLLNLLICKVEIVRVK